MKFTPHYLPKPWVEQRKLGRGQWLLRYVLGQFVLVSILGILIQIFINLIRSHRPLITTLDWLPFSIIWGFFSLVIAYGHWTDKEYEFHQRNPPAA